MQMSNMQNKVFNLLLKITEEGVYSSEYMIEVPGVTSVYEIFLQKNLFSFQELKNIFQLLV